MSNVVSLLCTPIYQALQMTVESLNNLDLQYTCEELMNNRSKELDFFFKKIYIYENVCVDIIEKIDPSVANDIVCILSSRNVIGEYPFDGYLKGLLISPRENDSEINKYHSSFNYLDYFTKSEIDKSIYNCSCKIKDIFIEQKVIEIAIEGIENTFIDICNSIMGSDLLPYYFYHWNYKLTKPITSSPDFCHAKDEYILLLERFPYCPVIYMDLLSSYPEYQNDEELLRLAHDYDISIPKIIQTLNI